MNRRATNAIGERARKFVSRVHRRRAIVRAVESAGVGVLIASGTSIALSGLLAWRGSVVGGAVGDSTQPIRLAGVLLSLGAACGILASIRRRPSLLDSAMYVDRALHADDLIASALLISAEISDVSRAIASLADQRIAGVRPSSLPLQRFASQTWTGIGLAVACAVTTSLLFTGAPAMMQAQQTDERPSPFVEASEQANRSAGASSPDPSRSTSSSPADAEDSDHDRATRANNRSSALGIDSAGAGRSRTNDLKERGPRQTNDATAHLEPRNPASAIVAADAAGSGLPTRDREISPLSSAAGIVDRETSPRTAPWQSDSWPTNRANARDALRNGAIPDSYRDLVRAYFDLPK